MQLKAIAQVNSLKIQGHLQSPVFWMTSRPLMIHIER